MHTTKAAKVGVSVMLAVPAAPPIAAINLFEFLRWLRYLMFKEGSAACTHCSPKLTLSQLLNVPPGQLIRFDELTLVEGMARLVLPCANTIGSQANEDHQEERDTSRRR
jgi:hypothetical protein